jgi:hypothetical protein
MREVEIDCPSDCVHLKTGREWEAGRGNSVPARPPREFSQQFVQRHGIAISALSQAIVDARRQWPAMVDSDVRSALEALEATAKTLESGLYYETLPEGAALADSLYHSLKSVLDELIEAPKVGPALRVSDARSILEFLISTCEFHANSRPKSRRYLDWLGTMVPERDQKEEPNRLILP